MLKILFMEKVHFSKDFTCCISWILIIFLTGKLHIFHISFTHFHFTLHCVGSQVNSQILYSQLIRFDTYEILSA